MTRISGRLTGRERVNEFVNLIFVRATVVGNFRLPNVVAAFIEDDLPLQRQMTD